MQTKFTFLLLFVGLAAHAQKKPLDHTVYDSWESIGAKYLTNNGQWAAFTIQPQEGDATLYFTSLITSVKKSIPRGGQLQFSADSKFGAFTIKPQFAATRQDRIKKKKPEDMTKDTLAIINLTSLSVTKIPKVKSFKLPETGLALLAYQLEKQPDTSKKTKPAGTEKKDQEMTFVADEPGDNNKEGSTLIFKNLISGNERSFKFVTDYAFSKSGKQLVISCSGSKKDKTALPGVFLLNTEKGTLKALVSKKGNFKSFVFDDEGEHLAFLGEHSPEKAEIKDFNIYYNSLSLDTAQVLVENDFPGMPAKWAISGDGKLTFSKDGDKLFFGIAPIKKPKDTTLIDFDHAKLDIWGYKDDYLQPMQLSNLQTELKRSYLTYIDIYNSNPRIIPLANIQIPDASMVNQGTASFALASSNYGNRLESQWTGDSKRDFYLIDLKNGNKKKILNGINGYTTVSPGGNYVLYFDNKTSNWYTYNIKTEKITNLNGGMSVKFADEENDVPDDASHYGLAGWTLEDKNILINDKYDVWAFSPDGKTTPKNLTNGFGRKNGLTFRYQRLDSDEKFIGKSQEMLMATFNHNTKENGFYKMNSGSVSDPELIVMGPFKYSPLLKAKDAERYLYDKSNYTNSPNVYASSDLKKETRLSNTNPQQQSYNWGTAELVKWTTPKGFKSEGVLYKPENFDPNKKYPMIVYFYEKLSQELYTYSAPSPTPSRLNVPYFVSNGYLIFTPDVSYETGYPGKSAIEYINSGVEYLKKNNWVDGTKIGIQGQSWGGYQVAYLITQTNMYAAAWAGAPVANMTSAYGGIRWSSGMSRQFQYEKTQSRIGATLWEKPELYIENSPLFFLPKVNTPLVIMSNDADGAVPWYQGIELFTGLKRLGKPAWLLNYNNEAHNLMLRQNRKDIQIREQQFFDYYLKGGKAPVWMVGGIPATEKGKTWGFELTDEKP